MWKIWKSSEESMVLAPYILSVGIEHPSTVFRAET